MAGDKNDQRRTHSKTQFSWQTGIRRTFCNIPEYASERLTRDQVIEKLVRLGVSNDAGAGRRVGNASLIFKAGKEMDALSLILDSKRLPSSVLAAAHRLTKLKKKLFPDYNVPRDKKTTIKQYLCSPRKFPRH